MVAIPLKTRLNPDGTLDVRIKTGLPELDVEVLVIVQPEPHNRGAWPEGFFEKTYGAFATAPLERPAQPEYDSRENLY